MISIRRQSLERIMYPHPATLATLLNVVSVAGTK
jgi:hypothetical protein